MRLRRTPNGKQRANRKGSGYSLGKHWPLTVHRDRREGFGPQGADAEAARRTDGVLGRLPEREWIVLEDIDPKHGLDHVLVGPGGVFAITSRKPGGPGVKVRDGVLWLRKDGDVRAGRPGVAINRYALDASRSLHREIRARTGRGPHIHPVVVLWCEFPQTLVESSQIAFIHGRDLLSWLASRPQRLDEPGRSEIAQAIRATHSTGHSRILHLRSRGQAA